jgi:acyl dehydratase
VSADAAGAAPPIPGAELPTFERTTGFAEWNRYAAVNDEFIDVHMSAEAARAAGQPDVFGMGNLRIAYAHALLHDWLRGWGGDGGDIASFSCQFRGLNFLGDHLTVHGRAGAAETRDGITVVPVELGVRNQDGAETMPASAELVLFGEGGPRMPPEPEPPPVPERQPGEHLDPATIGWLGRAVEPVTAYPVGANDIRRWALATYHPEDPPPDLLDEDVAARGPWGRLVAPRDFNPFAWVRAFRPDAYPWMRGMGTEPGTRGLNGGQRSLSFAPVGAGDVITVTARLVDAYEKPGRLGTMLFLVDESRWTNQRGELVRLGLRTSIYY